MTNNKLFDLRPFSELMAVVSNSWKKFDAEGLIDKGTCLKTVLWCNDKLGVTVREIRECAIPVQDYKAKLPLDFEKLYYIAALECSNSIVHNQKNPFDNSFDSDIVYEVNLDRGSLGCVDNYMVTVNKITNTTVHSYGSWIQLSVDPSSVEFCHIACPNKRKQRNNIVRITKDTVHTDFRTGTLYVMYIGMMKDDMGNILFPFHPMITPWYEWCIKEQIVTDAIFNSDMKKEDADYFLKIAQDNRSKSWIDAWNITLEKAYGEYVEMQRQREFKWYNQYFKLFQ